MAAPWSCWAEFRRRTKTVSWTSLATVHDLTWWSPSTVVKTASTWQWSCWRIRRGNSKTLVHKMTELPRQGTPPERESLFVYWRPRERESEMCVWVCVCVWIFSQSDDLALHLRSQLLLKRDTFLTCTVIAISRTLFKHSNLAWR